MKTSSQFLEFLAAEGRPLAEINPGSTELALKPSAATRALELLKESNVAIVGGDLLVDVEGKLSYAYQNWYCERNSGETSLDFAHRSQQVAREFVAQLEARTDECLYVVFVFSESAEP